MIQIKSAEIHYFRSIYRIQLKKLTDLNILSGKNDCGKSNIIKALNLFFNNETDWKTPIDFTKDFSFKRRDQVKKETVKGRQFIRVKLVFNRGLRAGKSLPKEFSVTKTWYRGSPIPETKTSIEQQFIKGEIGTKNLSRAQAGVQNYINKIRFEYIPAIKDRRFYIYSLGLLQDIVLQKGLKGQDIQTIVADLNTAVDLQTEYLKQEFHKVIGIGANIKLPQDLSELFRAFSVGTSLGAGNMVPLLMRGDGIQTRFLPSLLHYITEKSNLFYIWGFEEPENCLEHLLASALADDLKNKYSKKAQIFLTTHSPALVGMEGDGICSWRIFRQNETTDITADLSTLQEELGIIELYRKHEKEIQDLREQKSKLDELYREIKQSNSPILLTEGKSDVLNLETAWNKLYPSQQRGFRIIKCDPYNHPDLCAGGAVMLRKALESCREDLPLTIGLFDLDEEGIKEYGNLDGNFDVFTHFKIHKNKRCAAFLIPPVNGKEQYAVAENLPLEFLFPDEHIVRVSTDGRGLVFVSQPIITRVGKRVVKEERTVEPQYRKISDGKVYFAENVVPNLPQEAFGNFEGIFSTFNELLKKLG